MIHWPDVGVCFTVRQIASEAPPTAFGSSPEPPVGVQTSSSHVDSCITPSHTASHQAGFGDGIHSVSFQASPQSTSTRSRSPRAPRTVNGGMLIFLGNESRRCRSVPPNCWAAKPKPPLLDPVNPERWSIFERRKRRGCHHRLVVTCRTGSCRLGFAESLEDKFPLSPSVHTLQLNPCAYRQLQAFSPGIAVTLSMALIQASTSAAWCNSRPVMPQSVCSEPDVPPGSTKVMLKPSSALWHPHHSQVDRGVTTTSAMSMCVLFGSQSC